METSTMKIEVMKTCLIKPYWRNPRINQQTVDALCDSIREYGFRNPVNLDMEDTIITGHTRYKAVCKLEGTLGERIKQLREEGKDSLAENLKVINEGCIFIHHVEDLDDEQIRKFRIADNKIGELSQWDNDFLKAELRELDSIIGFTDEEIDHILENTAVFNTYTDANLEATEEKMEHRYEEIAKQDTLVEMTCPYCKETFSVRPDEVETDRKWNKINKEAEKPDSGPS